MPTIQIREVAAVVDGFTAEVTIAQDLNTSRAYPVTLRNPFQHNEEADLEFFFEEWYQFPTLDRERADRARLAIAQYGQELFEQLLKANSDAYADYRDLRRSQAFERGTVLIEIIGSPEFQGWHWEALRDPDLPEPLSLMTPIVRRDPRRSVANPARVEPSGWLNLLVVTARPGWSQDVNYRTISRPLVEAIANAQLPVKVELLRPGTWEALDRHLQDVGPGFYHAVHFDLHGSVLTYKEASKLLDRPAQASGQTFRRGYGLGDLPEYDGYRAFLSFEGEAAGQSILVEAAEVANLLKTRQIPLCILNACQSAKQISGGEGPAAETSLGAKLLEAGMQAIVAMRYSVMVRAAELMMTRFYQALFTEQPVMEAIRLGRRELWQTKTRPGRFNMPIELEDWLLPVVYSGATVNLNLRPLTADEEAARWTAEADRDRFEPPIYGFVGRDTDILELERRLLQPDRNALLLQGMGGTGKTTLLRYLRDWWQRTGLIERSFYFGYDERAHNLEQIAASIFQQLDPEGWLRFQSFPLAARLTKLTQLLRSRRYALILDNLESVTAAALSIPNSLPESEQRALAQWLRGLVGGKTLILLGSRGAESWLEPVYGANRLGLRGLDRDARTELAQKILERQVGDSRRIAQIKDDPAFGQLMKLLDGYPLAMEVVLGNLKRQTPSEIVAGLAAADVNLDNPQAQGDKTQSIIACIDYSHGALSAAAQQALLCLAPFSGFINCDGNCLEQYAARLAEQPALAAWLGDSGAEILAAAVQEAVDWGLLSPISPEVPILLTIQPTLPYFLKLKLAERDKETQAAIRNAFKQHYIGLANYYNNRLLKSKEPDQRQLGIFFVRQEYENCYAALQICLEKFETADIFFCLFQYLYVTQDWPTAKALAEQVRAAHAQYPPEIRQGKIGLEITMSLDRLASCQLELKDYAGARAAYLEELQQLDQLQGVDRRQILASQASTYHQLGRVAQGLREYAEARRCYQQALEIKIEFGESPEERLRQRYEQAGTYHQLGIVAQELREFAEARRCYQQALEIKIEFGDRYSQASTYGQLGSVAQELREFAEARRCYQQALEIKIEFGDRYSQASTYHQLGIVAQELREFAEARRCYQQALEIKIEFGDRYSQASTYHQLGIVAQELREFAEARRCYQQSLEINIEFGDRYEQADTYHQLGIVAQELREFAEARRCYQQSLEINIEFGDRYEQADTYHQLGNIAYLLREFAAARRCYQQALEINIEFGDSYSQASTFNQLGLLSQATENFPKALDYFLQALQIFAQFEDTHHAQVVLRNIANLYQQTQDPNILTAAAEILGCTPDDLATAFTQQP
ncbi:MAG: tetratricopeptide repeat protein [Limnothrix sp. BL-A-16]